MKPSPSKQQTHCENKRPRGKAPNRIEVDLLRLLLLRDRQQQVSTMLSSLNTLIVVSSALAHPVAPVFVSRITVFAPCFRCTDLQRLTVSSPLLHSRVSEVVHGSTESGMPARSNRAARLLIWALPALCGQEGSCTKRGRPAAAPVTHLANPFQPRISVDTALVA